MDAEAIPRTIGLSSSSAWAVPKAVGPAVRAKLDQSPLSVSSCRSHSGSCTRSRKCQLSPQAAANDGLSVCFRVAARSAAKLFSKLQRGNVLAVMAGLFASFF